MSPRRKIQTDVPETDDQGGLAQTNVFETEGQDGWLAVMAFLLMNIHVCHLPWPYVSETDVPETDDRDGGSRRMSLRPKVKT